MFWFAYEGRPLGVFEVTTFASLIALIAMVTPWFIGSVSIALMVLALIILINGRRKYNRKKDPQSEKKSTEKADKITSNLEDTPAAEPQDAASSAAATSPSLALLTSAQLSQKTSDLDTISRVLAEFKSVLADYNSDAPKRWLNLPDRLSALSINLNKVYSPDFQANRDELQGMIRGMTNACDEASAGAKDMLKHTRATLTILCAALALTTIAASPVWLPLEKIEVKRQVYVGYVLNETEDEVVILQHEPRGVIRMKGESDRTFCTDPDDEASSAPLRWLTDSAPALLHFTSSRFTYPDCPAEP